MQTEGKININNKKTSHKDKINFVPNSSESTFAWLRST